MSDPRDVIASVLCESCVMAQKAHDVDLALTAAGYRIVTLPGHPDKTARIHGCDGCCAPEPPEDVAIHQ